MVWSHNFNWFSITPVPGALRNAVRSRKVSYCSSIVVGQRAEKFTHNCRADRSFECFALHNPMHPALPDDEINASVIYSAKLFNLEAATTEGASDQTLEF